MRLQVAVNSFLRKYSFEIVGVISTLSAVPAWPYIQEFEVPAIFGESGLLLKLSLCRVKGGCVARLSFAARQVCLDTFKDSDNSFSITDNDASGPVSKSCTFTHGAPPFWALARNLMAREHPPALYATALSLSNRVQPSRIPAWNRSGMGSRSPSL